MHTRGILKIKILFPEGLEHFCNVHPSNVTPKVQSGIQGVRNLLQEQIDIFIRDLAVNAIRQFPDYYANPNRVIDRELNNRPRHAQRRLASLGLWEALGNDIYY
jgi:hypothetical protein